MTGDDGVTAQFLCSFVQGSKFQELVAVDAGIRCFPEGVGTGEGFHDIPAEFVHVVKDKIRHAQTGSDAAGVFYIPDAAAGLAAAAGIGVVVELHGAAYTFISLVKHEFCGYG